MSIQSRQHLLKVTYTREEVSVYRAKYRAYKELLASDWQSLPYNQFLSIVKQRPDPSLSTKDVVCPLCMSKDVDFFGGTSTCVGGFKGYDPNHRWQHCLCKKCDQKWTIESKGIYPSPSDLANTPKYNVWWTQNNKVLYGIPSCFEEYIYSCSKCDGNVRRHYYRCGTTESCGGIISHKDGKPQFDTVFKCDKCDASVLNTGEYYLFDSPHRPRKPFGRIMRWRIIEEPGIAIINDYAVSKSKLD